MSISPEETIRHGISFSANAISGDLWISANKRDSYSRELAHLSADPIPITPGSVFSLSSEMRYALNSRSKGAYFSVIQLDSAGNSIGFDETVGTSGDNAWTWVAKALIIHSAPNATSIRIRFGLVSVDESYLDVDAVY